MHKNYHKRYFIAQVAAEAHLMMPLSTMYEKSVLSVHANEMHQNSFSLDDFTVAAVAIFFRTQTDTTIADGRNNLSRWTQL